MNKKSTINSFKRQINYVEKLKSLKSSSSDFKKWKRNTEILIENTFGKDTRHIKEFTEIHYGLFFWSDMTPDEDIRKAFCDGLDCAKSILDLFIDEIDEYWDDDNEEDKKSRNESSLKHKQEIYLLDNKNVWPEIKNDFGVSKHAFGQKVYFVKDVFKRRIIFRDIGHAYLLAEKGFSKPALILAGGVIEELLRLYLKHKNISPSNNTFDGYIKACEKHGLLKSGISNLSHSFRYFRNIVHLEKEMSSKYTISKATAKGAVSSIFTISNDFLK